MGNPEAFVDDVTVYYRLPVAKQLSPSTLFEPLEGKLVRVPGAPGVRVSWDGTVLRTRISVPKLGGNPLNFPGRTGDVHDFRHIGPAISDLIRVNVPDVTSMVVQHVAATADVVLDDIPAILRGGLGLRRRAERHGPTQYLTDDDSLPVVRSSGLLWRAPRGDGNMPRGVAFGLYDKALELREEHGRVGRERAALATNVLRITATIHGIEAVRRTVNGCAKDEAVTLAAFLREDVLRYAIGNQLHRLDLDTALDSVGVSDHDVNGRAFRLLYDTFSPRRAASLVVAHTAWSAGVTIREYHARTHRSVSSIYDDRKKLRALGLAPCDAPAARAFAAGRLRAACAHFLEEAKMRPLVSGEELTLSPFARHDEPDPAERVEPL